MVLSEIRNNFSGREEALNLLKRRVLDLKEGYRQNLAFLGARYIGKSFLLEKFLLDLEDKDIIPIYLDLEQRDFRCLFENFVGNILHHFSKNNDLPLHDDVSLFCESLRKYLPQTVEAIFQIQKMIAKKRISEGFRQLMLLPEVFTVESGKFCLVILDEFHCLEDLAVENVFQELGKRIMTQKRCLYVVSSSLVSEAKKILSERLSLLFGHFEIVDIDPFDAKTAQQFIAKRTKGIRIGEDLKNFLFNFTGGYPFYLDILLSRMIDLSMMYKQEVIFFPILAQSVEDAIFNRWGILSRHFEIMVSTLSSGKNCKEIYSILISLSSGCHKTEEIVSSCDLKRNFVKQTMLRLIELGVVERNGSFYYLKDKLFRYWIKYIFQKKLRNIDCNALAQKESFRGEFALAVSEFQKASQKDIPNRLIELLRCFNREAFNCRGRRYALPIFQKIKMVKLREQENQPFEIIKASTEDGPWLIVFKNDTITETDVELFLKESKKGGQKAQRRILITLKNLDDPVRLRALQEKIWIWSEGELNLLMNMYDKPYIA